MPRTTPLYGLQAFAPTDRARDISSISWNMMLRLEAILQQEGRPPLDSDLVDLVKRLNAVEARTADTDWIYPPLMNGWKNQSGEPFRYRRMNGFTLAQGYISGGSATQFFVIPEGFRPSQPIRVDTLSGTGSAATSMSFPVGADGILAAGTGLSPHMNVFWPADQ